MADYRQEIGRILSDARQSAGLSLGDIAARLRIRPVYLQAIEAGQFELLPALPQTVGFTRSYARHLGVDVETSLSRLGADIQYRIESTDYSEPEPIWTQVPPRRIAWVGAGVVAGMALLAALIFDFGSSDGDVAEAVASYRQAPVPTVRSQVPGYFPIDRGEMTAARVSAPPSVPVSAPPSEPVSASAAGEAPSSPGTPASSSVYGPVVSDPAPAAGPAEISDPVLAPATQLPPSDARHIVTESVYFRAAPGNEGAILGVLNPCEPVRLHTGHNSAYWREVTREDGTTGWVFRDYLSDAVPAACS